MLSDEQITKFQVLYKNRFGREIGREEALEKGIKLIRLMQLVLTPKMATLPDITGDNMAKSAFKQ